MQRDFTEIDEKAYVGRHFEDVVPELSGIDENGSVLALSDEMMSTCDWEPSRIRVYYSKDTGLVNEVCRG